MVFLKEFFEKVDFEKNQQASKTHTKLLSMQSVKDDRLVKQKTAPTLGTAPTPAPILIKAEQYFAVFD